MLWRSLTIGLAALCAEAKAAEQMTPPPASVEQAIAGLEANTFEMRQAAQEALLEAVRKDVLETGTVPSWVSSIVPERTANRSWKLPALPECAIGTEAALRLRDLPRAADGIEDEHLLIGTHIDVPPSVATLGSLLDHLSNKLGVPVRLESWKEELAKQPVRATSGTLWEILLPITLPRNQRLAVHSSAPNCILLKTIDAHEFQTAASGRLQATLHVPTGKMVLQADQGTTLSSWNIRRLQTGLGEQAILHCVDPFPVDPKKKEEGQLLVPFVHAQTAKETVWVTVHFFYRRACAFPIDDVSAPQKFSFRNRTVMYAPLSSPDEEGAFSCALHIPVLFAGFDGDVRSCWTCVGYGPDHAPIAGDQNDASTSLWKFPSKPTRIRFFAPDNTSQEGTTMFTFPDVPWRVE